MTDLSVHLHTHQPRVDVELTESELRYVLDSLAAENIGAGEKPAGDSAYFKLRQALEVETGPGGRFHDPA